MGLIDERIERLGLRLPPPLAVPGVNLPFAPVRIVGDIAYVAGHGPQADDGTIAAPLGTVGNDVSIDEARELARKVALSVIADLRRALGDLDRIMAWGRVFGMVRCAPHFTRQPEIINGFSEVVLDLFGPDIGAHARSAIGVTSLPFGGIPVEVEAIVHIR